MNVNSDKLNAFLIEFKALCAKHEAYLSTAMGETGIIVQIGHDCSLLSDDCTSIETLNENPKDFLINIQNAIEGRV